MKWEDETHPVRKRVWEMSQRKDGLLWTREDCRVFPRERFSCCFGNGPCPLGEEAKPTYSAYGELAL